MGPGRFLNGQELTRILFSFTVRNPRNRASFLNGDVSGKLPPSPSPSQHQHLLLTWGKMLPYWRGKWAVSQKRLMILNSTAICNRIWTVPCWLVAQVKTSSVQKFAQIRVKTPAFPRDMPQSIILSLIVVCNFLLKVGNVDYIFESNISLLFLFFLLFFCQPCHECMAIGYKRCYKCYGRGRVRITDSFSH